MINIDWTISTAGDGYWSSKSKQVKITKMHLGYLNQDETFGELRVYFDTETWDVEKDGLIYTDSLFLSELARKLFVDVGLDPRDVDYSEQGMQKSDYVSFDVGSLFLQTWRDRFSLTV